MDAFFCHCTATEGTYQRQLRKCAQFPIFQLYAKIYIIFSNKMFYVLIFEKYTLLNLIFGKYLEPWKELSMVKTPAKMLDWCIFWLLIMIFMDKTIISFFYFQRLLSKK